MPPPRDEGGRRAPRQRGHCGTQGELAHGRPSTFGEHVRYSFSVARKRAMRAFSLLMPGLLSSVQSGVGARRDGGRSIALPSPVLAILHVGGERHVIVPSSVGVEALEEASPIEMLAVSRCWWRQPALVLPGRQLDDGGRWEWYGATNVCSHLWPSVCGRSAVPTKAAIEGHERPLRTLAASGSGACGASHMLAAANSWHLPQSPAMTATLKPARLALASKPPRLARLLFVCHTWPERRRGSPFGRSCPER